LLIIEADWASWLKRNSSNVYNSTGFRYELGVDTNGTAVKTFCDFPEFCQAVGDVDPSIK
jgi:hypothetical protein